MCTVVDMNQALIMNVGMARCMVGGCGQTSRFVCYNVLVAETGMERILNNQVQKKKVTVKAKF